MKSPSCESAFVADRRLEAERLLADLEDLAHLGRRDAHLGGDLFGGGLAADVWTQLALHAYELVDLLHHVRRHADGARLVGHAAGDGLADPPGGIGRELVAPAVIELLDGADEAEVAFLDQVEEWHVAPAVALGDGHDQAQVGFDQFVLGLHVVALDALGQRDLLGPGKQRHLADLGEVQAHRVVLGVLIDRSSVGVEFSGSGSGASVRARRRRFVAFDDVDAELVEQDEDVVDLLGGQFDVLQPVVDVFGGQKALFAAFGRRSLTSSLSSSGGSFAWRSSTASLTVFALLLVRERPRPGALGLSLAGPMKRAPRTPWGSRGAMGTWGYRDGPGGLRPYRQYSASPPTKQCLSSVVITPVVVYQALTRTLSLLIARTADCRIPNMGGTPPQVGDDLEQTLLAE